MTELKLMNTTEEDSYNAYEFAILVDGVKVGAADVMAEDEDDEHAYVERIDIYDEYRNHGYGTEALNELSDKWYGIEIAPDNPDAQRLYARLGEESSWEDACYIDQGYGVYRI